MLQSSNCTPSDNVNTIGQKWTQMAKVCATNFTNFTCLSLSLLIPVRAYPHLWTSLFLLISVGWRLVWFWGQRSSVPPPLKSCQSVEGRSVPCEEILSLHLISGSPTPHYFLSMHALTNSAGTNWPTLYIDKGGQCILLDKSSSSWLMYLECGDGFWSDQQILGLAGHRVPRATTNRFLMLCNVDPRFTFPTSFGLQPSNCSNICNFSSWPFSPPVVMMITFQAHL